MKSGEIYTWWNREGRDMEQQSQMCILLTEIAEQLALLNKQFAQSRGMEESKTPFPRVSQ